MDFILILATDAVADADADANANVDVNLLADADGDADGILFNIKNFAFFSLSIYKQTCCYTCCIYIYINVYSIYSYISWPAFVFCISFLFFFFVIL